MTPLLAQKPRVDRAFERLYRLHALDVYRYAYNVLRNQADAEDVTQTTFMNAYRALERGDSPQSPHNWLIAIAHNVCRQRFRAAARRPLEIGFDEDVADRFVRPEDDDAASPADIRRALEHLAFNQRAALVMRELEGRSYAEIADVLEISVPAVETLIFRARRALREQLEESLTCGQAELLLSKQLDAALAKPERSQLRAHLRQCEDCRRLARSQRAQRSAFRALGAIPLPSSLASLFGGTAPVAAKVAAVVVTASVAGGVGYDVHQRVSGAPHRQTPRRAQLRPAPSTVSASLPAPRGYVAAAVSVVPTTKTAHVRHAPRNGPAVPRRQRPRHVVIPAVPAAPASHGSGRRAATPAQPAGPVKPVQAAMPARPAKSAKPAKATKPTKPARQPEHSPHPPYPGRGAGQGHGTGQPADGLTQTSQKDGARNSGERYLHP